MKRGYTGERPPEIHLLHLKVVLNTTPAVWRRLRVLNQLTLRELHFVVQTAMGWSNCHLHDFRIRGRSYGPIDADAPADLRDDRRVRLHKVLAPGDVFHYEYDFGDEWDHRIEVEGWSGMWPNDPPALCLEGARACPPEDCGGPLGYEDLLAALSDRSHPHRAMWTDWIGDTFDPETFDPATPNAILAALWQRPERRALH